MRALPPGQAATGGLRPFGLLDFARTVPQVPTRPVITVTGAVGRPTQFAVEELIAPDAVRVERIEDLHCVTTWSVLGLRWSGVPFRVVHDFVTGRVAPWAGARWVCFHGLDGYRSTLRLDDALAGNVLLADTLDGDPLTVDGGAPLRLIAPAHYGYKSVKHVCTIEYLREYDPGPATWKAHPRGRVAHEERSRFLPGRVWRPVYRAILPRARSAYDTRRAATLRSDRKQKGPAF